MATKIKDIIPNVLSKISTRASEMFGDNEGWVRQGKFTPGKQVESFIPGGYEGAKQRLQSTAWQNYTPLSMKESAVPAANAVFGKNTPAADIVGYSLRGATSLTPFGGLGTTEATNYFTPQAIKTYKPTTDRQKTAERIGRAVYGTALTAPLGGSNYALNIGSRAAQGTALGVGLNTASNLFQGKNLTENLGQSALTGLENSWQLAFTNLLADKVGAKYFPSLTTQSLKTGSNLLKNATSMGSPTAQKIFTHNASKIFQRALLETPIENTWFTALNKLNGNEKRGFVQAWMEDLLGTAAGNILFAGLNVGKQGVVDLNKPQLEEIGKSIENTAKKYFGGSMESQRGYIDFLGNTVDGTARTNRFNNLVDAYYKPGATPEDKINSYAEIRKLATDIFGKKKIAQLTSGLNKDPENLIKAISDVLEGDIKTNRGYQEPFTMRNLLENKYLQRGGIDLNDSKAPFPQEKGTKIKPSIPEVGGVEKEIGNKIKIKRPTQTLNVDRLNLTEAEKNVVRSVESTKPRIKLKNKDVIKLAKEVGVDMDSPSGKQTANKIATQLNTRKSIVSETKKFTELQQNNANEKELMKSLEKIASRSKASRTQGTDIARQLQARNIMANELDTPMQKIFKLLDNAGIKQKTYLKDATKVNWEDANSVVAFYRKFIPAKFVDFIDKLRYTNMLSSPKTHIVNIASNLIQTAVQPVRRSIAGTYDWAIAGLTKRERRQFASEAPVFAKKTLSSVPKAWKATLDSLSGKKEITNLDIKNIPSGNKFMQAYSFPLRVLEAGDVFFRTLTREAETAALTLRSKKMGTKVDPVAIAKEAEDFAKEVIFRAELKKQGQGWMLNGIDAITGQINQMKRSQSNVVSWPTKIIAPFIQTPMNILKQGIEYSPLEFANMIKSKGNVPDQLAKATIGSMIFAGAGVLAQGGNTTWELPTNTKERNAFYAAGKQAYSIRIGNRWYAYTKLGPLAYPVAMAAALSEALKTREGDELALVTAGRTVAMMGAFFSDQSYMQGIGDLIDAMRGDEYKMSRMLANPPAQMVPYKSLITWVNRMVDPVYRKVDWTDGIPQAIAQSIMRDMPILSKSLPAYEDPLGNPSERQLPVLNAITPFTVTEEKEDFSRVYEKIVGEKKMRRAETLAKENIKNGDVARNINNKLMFLADDEVVTLDYGKVMNMPSGSAMERAKKEKATYSFIGQLMESGADDTDIDEILTKLKVPREDAEYYNIARQDNAIKSAYVFDVLQNIQTREEMLQFLASNRKEVNGEIIAANGVIDELYEEGLLTYEEKNQLKKIKQGSDGQLKIKTSGSGSGKISVSIPAKPKTPKFDTSLKVKIGTAARNKIKIKGFQTADKNSNYLAKVKQVVSQ